MGDEAFELFTSVRYDAALCSVPGDAALSYAGWNFRNGSPLYMLDFHRDRLLRAASHWGWTNAVATVDGEKGLRRIDEAAKDAVARYRAAKGHGEPGWRCRVTIGKDGQLSCEAFAATQAALVCLLPPVLPPPGFMSSAGESHGRDGQTSQELLQSLRRAMGQEPFQVILDGHASTSSAYTHYKTTRRQTFEAARQRAGIQATDRKEVLLVNAATGAIMDGSITTVFFWRNGRWVTPPVPPHYGQSNGSGGLDGTTRRWALERGLAVQEEVLARSLVDGEECWLSNGVRGFLYGIVHVPSDN